MIDWIVAHHRRDEARSRLLWREWCPSFVTESLRHCWQAGSWSRTCGEEAACAFVVARRLRLNMGWLRLHRLRRFLLQRFGSNSGKCFGNG